MSHNFSYSCIICPCVCRGSAAAGHTEQHSEGRDHPSETGAPAAAQRCGLVRYNNLQHSTSILFLSMIKSYLFGRNIKIYCLLRYIVNFQFLFLKNLNPLHICFYIAIIYCCYLTDIILFLMLRVFRFLKSSSFKKKKNHYNELFKCCSQELFVLSIHLFITFSFNNITTVKTAFLTEKPES